MNDRHTRIEQALGCLQGNRYDERAWADLYDNIVPRAQAIAFRVLAGDATASQDAVHDALLRLMRYASFERFTSADEFLKYFTTVVHRAALDALRRRRQVPGVQAGAGGNDGDDDTGAADIESLGSDGSGDPEAALSFKRAVENLSHALSARELLVCTLLANGYERSELAERLGATESTAAVIVHRLRAKLRDLDLRFRGVP